MDLQPTTYETFLMKTLHISQGERDLLLKNRLKASQILDIQAYSKLSKSEKEKEGCVLDVLLNRPSYGSTSNEIMKVIKEIFQNCPRLFESNKCHLSEFLLMGDIRYIVFVMRYLGKETKLRVSKQCIEVAHFINICHRVSKRMTSLYFKRWTVLIRRSRFLSILLY
jgi:hypothetical protein